MKKSQYYWKSPTGDIPIKVLSELGTGPDGREYLQVEGSSTGIPASECYIKEESSSFRPNTRKII